MSTVKVYQCDGPACEVHAAPRDANLDTVPPGWFSLMWLDGRHNFEQRHFHSISCLASWSNAWHPEQSEKAS